MQELLINKYYPKTLDDFVDIDISSLIKEFIKINTIKILFISKQSNGKTAFINAIINDYYGKSDNVLLINNIKEYGINYFKNEVIQFCRSPSLTNKKKMIVLDDFDSLNETNQQIFKNIIETYDINYILSCSTPQKLTESIQSMLHVIEIKPMTQEKINIIYDKIKLNEKLDIDEETKVYLVNFLNIKQIINNLEKFKLINIPITIEIAKEISSDIHPQIFQNFVNEIENKNLQGCVKILYDLYDSGYSVMDILYNFYEFSKIQNLDYSQHICKYIIAFHNIHEDVIELALFTNSIFKNIL
uniref:Replication factor C C-terminal domain-containing protein n=1 Tax=viral metagenome TaxID=1070528 RepID=A0A6C0HRQ6_9ZZZZ